MVDAQAWPVILQDLQRFGATPGELRRVAEMAECGLHGVALSLVDDILRRLRDEARQYAK